MIRQVEDADLDEVAAMIARSIRVSVAATAEEADFLIPDVYESLSDWKKDKTNTIHLLHETDERIDGVILVKNHWNLCDLFVDPKTQRRGIGRALLNEVLPACAENSPKGKLMVNSSTVGLKFYKALGFMQTGPGIERPGGCVPLELTFANVRTES